MIGGCFLVSLRLNSFSFLKFILVDEKSSHGYTYTLSNDVIYELQGDKNFIDDLRLGVELMVRSWGWVRSF